MDGTRDHCVEQNSQTQADTHYVFSRSYIWNLDREKKYMKS